MTSASSRPWQRQPGESPQDFLRNQSTSTPHNLLPEPTARFRVFCVFRVFCGECFLQTAALREFYEKMREFGYEPAVEDGRIIGVITQVVPDVNCKKNQL